MQYLAFTRPDFAFDAHKVNKFMHKPHDSRWLAVKRISRTQSQHIAVSTGLFITKTGDFRQRAYSDSDWATNRNDWRSVGAYYIHKSYNLIS